MPINAKCTFFFQGEGGFGWTETWYLVGNDLTAVFDRSTATNAASYFNRRRQILNQDSWISAIRVSDEAVLRDSRVMIVSKTNGKGLADKTFGNEQAYDALQIRLEAGDRRRRSLLMRGLPRNVVSGDGTYAPDADWTAAFPRWVTALKDVLQANVRTTTPGAALFPTAITAGAGLQNLILTFAAPFPVSIVPNSIIKVTGMGGASNLNGLWKVATVSGLVATTFPKKRPIFGTPSPDGNVKVITINYEPISNAQGQRGSKRSTGRPSNALRGRAAARRT